MFTLGKQYRRDAFRVAFISNDTTYQRSRSIRVDPQAATTDQRPVLTSGDTTSFNRYETLGFPHKVENNLGNAVAGIAAMSKYRLYRRLGMEIRFVDGGTTLARRNMILMIYGSSG